jgi:hypothetical protein
MPIFVIGDLHGHPAWMGGAGARPYVQPCS